MRPTRKYDYDLQEYVYEKVTESMLGGGGGPGGTGPQGIQGPPGPKGDTGNSIHLKGHKANEAAIKAITGATDGDTWLAEDTGDLWTITNGTWADVGHVQGPAGPAGTPGQQGPTGQAGPTGPAGIANAAEKAKLALITGSTAINFDEVLLDGDLATSSDVDDPNAAPTTLQRLINIATLRHALTAFGNIKREIYALVGNNPTMKMMIEDAGHAAQMQVVDKKANRAVASMEYLKADQSFSFTLMDKDTGVTKATFDIKHDGTASLNGKRISTDDNVEKMIREFRTTITQDIADHAKPTLAECKTTFKKLPHFDWTKDDDYYIKDTSGGKIVLIKYRGKPAGTEAAPGNFFYEVLTAAK